MPVNLGERGVRLLRGLGLLITGLFGVLLVSSGGVVIGQEPHSTTAPPPDAPRTLYPTYLCPADVKATLAAGDPLEVTLAGVPFTIALTPNDIMVGPDTFRKYLSDGTYVDSTLSEPVTYQGTVTSGSQGSAAFTVTDRQILGYVRTSEFSYRIHPAALLLPSSEDVLNDCWNVSYTDEVYVPL